MLIAVCRNLFFVVLIIFLIKKRHDDIHRMSYLSILYHILYLLTSIKCQKRKNFMFINKTSNGKNNVCGINVAKFRKEMNISQRELADRLQVAGLDVDKNAIQRIESGKRFVTDIELIALSKVLNKSPEELLLSEV